jgi:hypothetical protein
MVIHSSDLHPRGIRAHEKTHSICGKEAKPLSLGGITQSDQSVRRDIGVRRNKESRFTHQVSK